MIITRDLAGTGKININTARRYNGVIEIKVPRCIIMFYVWVLAGTNYCSKIFDERTAATRRQLTGKLLFFRAIKKRKKTTCVCTIYITRNFFFSSHDTYKS